MLSSTNLTPISVGATQQTPGGCNPQASKLAAASGHMTEIYEAKAHIHSNSLQAVHGPVMVDSVNLLGAC
jgi:hypothetical protein